MGESRLGELLVESGLLTRAELDAALKEQKMRGAKLGETLIRMGLVPEDEVMLVLASYLRLEYAELQSMELDENSVFLIEEPDARKYRAIPVGFDSEDSRCLRMAMADPTDWTSLGDLGVITGYRISPLLAAPGQIDAAIDRYFGKQSVMSVAEQYKKELDEREKNKKETERKEKKTADATGKKPDSSPIVIIVRSLLEQAVRQRASDIHFEPTRDGIRIRFRVDGRLREAISYDRSIYAAVIARLKIISGMDISEKRRPQDGRTMVVIDDREYDIRVSSIPTICGEKIEMRLTGTEHFLRDKRELGFREEALHKFDRMLKRPHGLILVTGPTGSGKSTTLYAAVSELNREDVNIVTVEEPVEMILEGVNQIQVNEKTGITFASALRAILRQDPDIIMIGEIRDPETARIAVQASITGHLVVSTLHTNDTASSVSRLFDMGVEPYLLSDALIGVVAQRLVRCLCRCKRGRPATHGELEELGADQGKRLTVYEPTGCQLCGWTGYYGRTGVYEVMSVSSGLSSAIVKMQPASRIREIARTEGMETLKEAALSLVTEGVTSFGEIRQILYEEEELGEEGGNDGLSILHDISGREQEERDH